MSNSDYAVMQWTVEAGLGFGGLPNPATLRPEERIVDLLEDHDELTKQNQPYWIALTDRIQGLYTSY